MVKTFKIGRGRAMIILKMMVAAKAGRMEMKVKLIVALRVEMKAKLMLAVRVEKKLIVMVAVRMRLENFILMIMKTIVTLSQN